MYVCTEKRKLPQESDVYQFRRAIRWLFDLFIYFSKPLKLPSALGEKPIGRTAVNDFSKKG